MQQAPYQYQTAAVPQSSGPAGSSPVFPMPVWVTVVRGFQLFIALVIAVGSGIIIHGLAFDSVVFALVCCLFTYAIVLYALLTEKATSCRPGYNYWAIISLDSVMVVFWLSAMAAVAAKRAEFIYTVDADCWSDGSAVNSGHCTITKRGRVEILSAGGQIIMSAIAGLSALMMLLFVASLAMLAHLVRLHHAKIKNDPARVEMTAQQQPMLYGGPVGMDQSHNMNAGNNGLQPKAWEMTASAHEYRSTTPQLQHQQQQQQQQMYGAPHQQMPQQQMPQQQQQQQMPAQPQFPQQAATAMHHPQAQMIPTQHTGVSVLSAQHTGPAQNQVHPLMQQQQQQQQPQQQVAMPAELAYNQQQYQMAGPHEMHHPQQMMQQQQPQMMGQPQQPQQQFQGGAPPHGFPPL